jgi:type I restriction enzyme M protein
VLEAVIGLPSILFYGTGIPACVLVLNRAGAAARRHVLIINADREYKEGKNQNSLRPEDLEKITHVYRNRLETPGYSRSVPYAEVAAEAYNLNIRRYVDNSPPPAAHDVRAHLHGGAPLAEVETLAPYFASYAGVRELLFVERTPPDAHYLDFAPALTDKAAIRRSIEHAPGVTAKHAAIRASLDVWWAQNVAAIEALPQTRNVFALRRQFMTTITSALAPHNMLSEHKVRGAIANYMKRLESDFKSIAASGWSAELIPDDELLAARFPDVLAQLAADRARIAAADAADADEEEGDAPELDAERGVLPSSLVRQLKEANREERATLKQLQKQVKAMPPAQAQTTQTQIAALAQA